MGVGVRDRGGFWGGRGAGWERGRWRWRWRWGDEDLKAEEVEGGMVERVRSSGVEREYWREGGRESKSKRD